MLEINDILDWTFIPSNYESSSRLTISSSTKKHLKNSIQKINEISTLSNGTNNNTNPRLLKDIYFLFDKNKNKTLTDILLLFSKKDARLLSWVLDYHPENENNPILYTDDFEIALKIIDNKWRDSFIITLWHIFLKNWNTLNDYPNQRKLLVNLLKKKVNNYNGSRKDIRNFISNYDLLIYKKSPSEYAENLIKNKIPINNAYLLINQKESILFYEYFSNVVIKYIDLIDEKIIKPRSILEIYSFIVKHNSKKTKLIACSELIINSKFHTYQKEIKNNTLNIVGDPIKKHLWEFNGLSEKEEKVVETARKKLNALLNQQFIKIFFEKLVQDDARKKYWLKFIDKIDDIKFVGNRDNHRNLKNIESISKYVDYRYKTTTRNQSTCGLVIYSKDFVFVEFTDTGALYIYRHHNFRVNLNNVSSMDDLKIWPISLHASKNSEASGYVDLNEEGRITHSGQWESRLNAWMREYYDNFKPGRSSKDVVETQKETYPNIFDKQNKNHNNNSIIRSSRYNPNTPDAQWESKLLYWSKKRLPGYIYSSKKDAWWRKK